MPRLRPSLPRLAAVAAAAVPLLLLPALGAAQSAPGQGQARLYAERAAMVALDRRCGLFDPDERVALTAFAAQARGSLLRAGASDASVAGYRQSAETAAARRACTDALVVSEAARVKRAHGAWRTQMTVSYPGLARSWTGSRAGVDAWRIWQDLGQGVRAGFLRTASGVVFAVEAPDTGLASARLHLRDAARVGQPRAGGRLVVPLRAGTRAHTAALRRPAETRPALGQPPRSGTLMVFADTTTRAVIAADPRDSFEIELVSRSGRVQTVVVEVGDIAAAWAFAQIS
jgi:hypothetical protein